jgi:uncharacterized protein YjbI with pentapeptide repeats
MSKKKKEKVEEKEEKKDKKVKGEKKVEKKNKKVKGEKKKEKTKTTPKVKVEKDKKVKGEKKLEKKKTKPTLKVKTEEKKDKVKRTEKKEAKKVEKFKRKKAKKEKIKQIVKKEEEQENLNKVFQNAQKYAPVLTKQVQEQIEKGVIDGELLEDFKKLVSGSAEKILSKTPELVKLYNNVAGVKEELYSRDKLYEIADNLGNILNGPFNDILSKDLPKFLASHNNDIRAAVGEFYEKNPELAEQAKAMGFDKEFALELATAVGTLSSELLPPFMSGIKDLVKDKKALVEVFEQINSLAQAEGSLSKLAGTAGLTASLYGLISASPDFTKAFRSKIPEILERHSEKLGPVLDKLMSKTQLGRNLTIKGKDILETVRHKTPQVMNLLAAIEKGGAIKIAIAAVVVLADPKMLKLTATLIGDLARYSYQKNIVTNATRRKEAGVEMNKIVGNILENTPSHKEGEKLPNLGRLLETQVNPEQKNALQYSLKNHDFRGLHLDHNPLKLQNFQIDNFRFNDTEFKGQVSFKGSKLENCSFKNVVFEKGVSFKGATIDAKSLETLVPAIAKHNSKHPENKITLDGVKITGDISKLSLKDISLKDADLSEAKTVSPGWRSEYKTDIQNTDLTGSKLKQGQQFKNEQTAKLDNAITLKKEQPKSKEKGGIPEKVIDEVEKIKDKKNLKSHTVKEKNEKSTNVGIPSKGKKSSRERE